MHQVHGLLCQRRLMGWRWRRKRRRWWRRNHSVAAVAAIAAVIVIIVVVVVVDVSRMADCVTAAGRSGRCHRCRVAKAPVFGQRSDRAEWLPAALATDLQAAIGVHALVAAQVRKLGVGFQADFALERLSDKGIIQYDVMKKENTKKKHTLTEEWM